MLRTIFKMNSIASTSRELIGDTYIKNIQYPPCITCKYFSLYVPRELHNDPKKNIHMSKCKKFGYMDIITGDIKYEAVSISRFDKNMCRVEGIYHIEKENH